MKKCMAAVMGVILMISGTACAGRKKDVYTELYERYGSLSSYYAESKITAINDRSNNTYHARQFYRSPHEYSIVFDAPEAVAGSGYVIKGGMALLKPGFDADADANAEFPVKKEEINLHCIADFFARYYKGEDSAAETTGGMGEKYIVLRCGVQNSRNAREQRLTIDTDTFLPVRLENFDETGKCSATVEYGEFKPNCELEDSLFE